MISKLLKIKKKNIDILHNHSLLLVVFFISLLNLLVFIVDKDYTSISYFILITIIAVFFTKNMLIILLVALVLTYLLKYGSPNNNVFETIENIDTSKCINDSETFIQNLQGLLTDQKNILKNKVDELRIEKENFQKTIDKLEVRLDNVTTKIKKSNVQCVTPINEGYTSKYKKSSTNKSSNQSSQTLTMDNVTSAVQQIPSPVDLCDQKKIIEEELKKSKTELERVKPEFEKAKRELDKQRKILDEFNKNTDKIKETFLLTCENDIINTEIINLKDKITILEDENKNLQKELDERSEAIEIEYKKSNINETELQEIVNTYPYVNSDNKTNAPNIQDNNRNIKELQQQIDTNNKKISEFNNQLAEYEKKVKSNNEIINQNKEDIRFTFL